MRKLACLLPLLAWSLPAAATKPKPATAKHSQEKSARKSKSKGNKKRPRVAVVHVSPASAPCGFRGRQCPGNASRAHVRKRGRAGAVLRTDYPAARERISAHPALWRFPHRFRRLGRRDETSPAAKFGAGGPGFTLAGRPFRGYRRFDIKGDSSRGWHTDGLVGRPGDGVYGLSGVSLTAQSAGQTVSLVAECEQLELHYLQQPGGGQAEFSVDGAPSRHYR